MKQEITGVPNEMPIVYVLITLGVLSYLATFPVIGMQNAPFNASTVAGFICGICALPLGLKLSEMRLNEARNPDRVSC